MRPVSEWDRYAHNTPTRAMQAPMYYRRANAAMIVYDITREKSFDEAQEWVKGQLCSYNVISEPAL